MSTDPGPVGFEERLHAPLRWWALLTMFHASLLLAFLVATPVWVAVGVTGTLALFVVVVLVTYGSARISVQADTFRAGRAQIPVALLGAPVPLDAGASHRVAGVDADARAYLLLRPYVKRAVQVPVQDPADPAPYWLVSTRRPDELAAALTRAASVREG